MHCGDWRPVEYQLDYLVLSILTWWMIADVQPKNQSTAHAGNHVVMTYIEYSTYFCSTCGRRVCLSHMKRGILAVINNTPSGLKYLQHFFHLADFQV